MAAPRYRVELTETALRDIEDIDGYWITRGEPERGQQYVQDLFGFAEAELSNPLRARTGRPVRIALIPGTLELTAFKTYRLIYRIEEESETVLVLRFWHSHRDEPPPDV